MRRVRVLRILIPVFLVPFAVWIALQIGRRGQPPGPQDSQPSHAGPRLESADIRDLFGGDQRLRVKVDVAEEDGKGNLRFQGVREVEIPRKDATALVVSADRGEVRGQVGRRVLRLEGGVTVRDDEEGWLVSLPAVDVEEASGEVRSRGAVRIKARDSQAKAASLVYGLKDQPTVAASLEMEAEDGDRVEAARAVFYRERQETELSGGVRIVRAGQEFSAPQMVLRRSSAGRLERVFASGGVEGRAILDGGQVALLSGQEIEGSWSPDGTLSGAVLRGDAWIRQTDRELRSQTIAIGTRSGGVPGWDLRAEGGVLASLASPDGPARLEAEALSAVFDGSRAIQGGQARGNVRFQNEAAIAQGPVAELDTLDGRRRVVFRADPTGRARLTSGRIRVAADRIDTDEEGVETRAEGRVEATLLPGQEARGTSRSVVFRDDEAVHFVSERMLSSGRGSSVQFQGNVRGWQGERSLQADDVRLDDPTQRLQARGAVTTRSPIREGVAISQPDYVEIRSLSLDYDGLARSALYEGAVRVHQAEGWLEGERLEADLEEEGGVREMRVFEKVRFELRPAAEGRPADPVEGTGDRLVYGVAERVLLLSGDRSPATLRRAGAAPGATRGRALRYALDGGTIVVESGERGRAEIRTNER